MVGADPRQWRSWYRNTLRKSRRKLMSGNGKDKCGLKGGKGTGGQNPHWEVELDVVNACGKGPTRKVVWIGRIAKLKIDALMGKFKNQEWFAYLLGDEMRVKDLYLPEQRASSSFVGHIENEEYNKLPVIGAIHSHHHMDIDMSGHDHEFVNSNHNISLLVQRNSQGQRISGQVRIKVPCGALYITDADVRLDLEVEFDKKKFMEEIDDRINKRQPQKVTYLPDATARGFVPDYMRTFPNHSQACACSECQKDRRKYINMQRRQSQEVTTSSTWDTEEKDPKIGDVEFDGAWICEECSKINYEDKDDDEKMTECVWCQSPRGEEEEPDELTSVELEIEKYQEMDGRLTSPQMIKALQERFNETLEQINGETVLENCIDEVSRYLLIVKTVMDEGVYKKQLDEFSGMLSLDYDEKEDDVLNSIVDKMALIEELLSEEEEETEENTETEEENSKE